MYYEVKTKCGHVGKQNYIIIDFPIKAETASEAAKIARNIPRVKHNYKDAILSVCKLTYEEYKNLVNKNSNDPYLKCKNKQEQKNIENFEDRIIYEVNDEKEQCLCIWKHKKAIRNIKKYSRFNDYDISFDEYEYAY